ncbi:hypothetical protein CEB3_c21240 [Peptococcaceae bacterium CEB3]|nr:hypothetical protein CEB3_c21240 [Peptococcaceae bacterium CEB3]
MSNQMLNQNPRKSPGVAAVLSFLISGLGQIYNGRILRGLIIIGIQFINVLLMFVFIGYLTGLITWIWAIYDAYKLAEKINQGSIPGGGISA